jgi:exodeoxyribonuclease VII small subunit
MTTSVRATRMSDISVDNLTFEQALAQLDLIVRDLENGQTGLEEALAHYETGVKLLKHCYNQLSRAEQRILLVTGQDEQGQPVSQPFEHAATADTDKNDVKRRRKKPEEPEKLF